MTIDEYHLLYDFDIRIQYDHGCEMVHTQATTVRV